LKATTFEILMSEATTEKLLHIEDALQFAGSIFKKSPDECKLIYSSLISDLDFRIKGQSIKLQQEELEKIVNQNIEKNSTRLLLVPFKEKVKLHQKYILNAEHNIIFDSVFPVLTYKGKLQATSIKKITVPLSLNEDFMPLVMRVLKFVKSIKNASLHIVSSLFNADDFTLNKATQQLSFLNHLFVENGVKYTAEIITSQSAVDMKSAIIVDHINRIESDLVVLFKGTNNKSNNSFSKEKTFEILTMSNSPTITFL
jgi:hypothetical protein